METNPALADPVLDTAVGVGVVAVRLPVAVQVVSAVQTVVKLVVAVLVTLVTDRPGPAVCVIRVVAAIVLQVVHHVSPLIVVPAQDVVGLGVGVRAVPVVPGQ